MKKNLIRKKAFLAGLVFCLALTASACSMAELTDKFSLKQGNNTNGSGSAGTISGSEVRLVSVENVEKYIKIAEYKGLNLDRSAEEITWEQVDTQIAYMLRNSWADVKDVSSPVQMGDLVTINYTGLVNGKAMESESLYDLVVGEGGMIEGFEENLVGMCKGETRKMVLLLPDDFYLEEMAGQNVTYRVTIVGMKRAPELTDSWASQNAEAATVAEYREQVRAQMQAEADAKAEESLRNLAWNIVLTNSEVVEYPKNDMESAMDDFKKQVMKYNNGSGMELEEFVKSQGMTMESFEAQCRQYAESKVKQNLIVQGIMNAEGLALDDAKSLEIQEQLITDFGTSSLEQLIDTYGQTRIDEAIGLLRVEDFIVSAAESSN